jgi:hypothetical protein
MFKLAILIISIAMFGTTRADTYMDSGPQVIHIHVYGTLKMPLPGSTSLDFHERGTGFIVSPDGLILSAAHLIPDSSLFDKNGYQIIGMLPVRDVDRLNAESPFHTLSVVSSISPRPPFDVVLLRMEDAKFPMPYLRLCNGYRKGDGTRFPILGYQGGDYLLTTNWGAVSAGEGAKTNIQIDTDINSGNSGGPIFNEQGMVFGMVIGEKEIDDKRMDNASLVVPMGKIITTLGNSAKELTGKSYEPNCNNLPNQQVTTEIISNVTVDKMTDQRLSYLLPPLRPRTISYVNDMLKAPSGYKWVEVSSASVEGTNVSSRLVSDGKMVRVKGVTDLEVGVKTANIKLNATLESLPAKPLTKPTTEIRTIPYSKTLKTHSLRVTREKFVDIIPAPQGYIFQDVIKIDYQSINGSPSNGAIAKVSKNGSELELTYTLESGPFYNRWNGWMDAYITVKLVTATESETYNK